MPAVLEHIEGDGDILKRAVRRLDEFVHLGVGSQVDHHIGRRVLDRSDAPLKIAVAPGEILEHIGKSIHPGIRTLVDTEDRVTIADQAQREVGANLPARSGYQYTHGTSI